MKIRLLALLVLVGCASATEGPDDEATTGVARSAFVTEKVEAENAVGSGTVEGDPTASNGRDRVFSAIGQSADATISTVGTMHAVRVRARAGVCAPQLEVLVEGSSLGTASVTATTYTDYAFATPAYPAGNHTITFRYATGPQKCLLHVDVASITTDDPAPPPPPFVVEAESAVGGGTVLADGTASGGQYRAFTILYSNATASFTTTSSYAFGAVTARRTGCSSGAPILLVTVDGHSDYVDVTSSSWTDFALTAPPLASGNHSVTFFYRYADGGCMIDVDKATFSN